MKPVASRKFVRVKTNLDEGFGPRVRVTVKPVVEFPPPHGNRRPRWFIFSTTRLFFVRGYASLVAGFVMLVILFTSLSVLFVAGVRETARIKEAEAFSSWVESLEEKIVLNVAYTEWNKDANVFLATITNTGRLSVDLNDIVLFIDGTFVGRCGEVNCYEENPNGELAPFEELNVVFEYPIHPHRLLISSGPVERIAYPSRWRSGCRYRRMVFVENGSSDDLNGYQIPVDLPPDFDYSHAAPDGYDVLFTLSDAVTEIPYWIEYWNVGGQSRIWVKVDVPAGGSTYVYMYYGGCSPSSWTVDDVFDAVIPGLVSYWNFEEGGGSVARDVSGNGYDMNLFNVEWSPGQRGRALLLHGDNNSHGIVRGFSGFPSDAITVFFRMQSSDENYKGTPFSYAVDGSSDNEFLIFNYNDFRIYRGDNTYRKVDASATDGVWHYIAASWDTNGNYAFYLDGSATRTGTGFAEGTTIADGGTLVIGQEQDEEGGDFDSSQAFRGLIDDVAIFNRVLSPEEISAMGENDMYATPHYLGYALVRKYAPSPPSASVRGEEHI